jgi:DNA-binding transcriptional ArsR family regulator
VTTTGQVLEALADRTRRGVVEQLVIGPRRAGELAQTAGVSASAMSRHLRVLLGAGLIADERNRDDARLRVFRLRPEGWSELEGWLDVMRAGWTEQLRAFHHYAEERRKQ